MATTRDIKTIDHGLLKFINRRNKIDGHGVKFGIQADAGKDEDGKVDILDYALINEYGTETIPSRPFMRDFFEKNRRPLSMAMDRAAGLVDEGKPVGQVLAQMGVLVEGQQKLHVREAHLWAEPNADSTKARKKSDKPLIHHGLLAGAIRYVKI
ncbi:MAG TPA: hypothetical protein VHQ92_01175 [Pseudolabrys sp.]|nr:hypothetical protein [Pseudolabrys sp.]